MAPDLNSVPASPRPLAATITSRRTSTQMSAPAIPPISPSLNILPSNQNAVNQTASPINSPTAIPTAMASPIVGDNSGVEQGPGPLRHPRPLTAADLHLQLEKEQEAVVNRLTRELSMLRATHNASVVSNSSSTSTGLPDGLDHSSNHLLSGPFHPVPSHRHHRTSSNTSIRSITAASLNTLGSGAATTVAPDRARGTLPRHDSIPNTQSMSRQNSTTGSRQSGASSPAPQSTPSSYQNPDNFTHFYQQRPIPHREPSSSSYLPIAADPNHIQTTGRHEEIVYHRNELDSVRRENEALKRRIRELERTLRARRQSDASRTRSESVSTTASVSGLGRGREREKEGEDDAVRVGESARSAGVHR
ncbi:hypothetical protein BJ878DRAFT_412182 [Calycina marina]|uniref:Uncharacterized protein n=1 Tax=Calycina marina TaxID=1763456 RepID=A0A9P7ZAZ5_9HELO|nr:hypothetical protein BJ878DRAFT_412182 [Calycina marina]